MYTRKETFKKGITIKDLKKGDIIYISKILGGYQVIFECSFKKLF